jgi:alpha-tubulin suppressor-like RCC1 family protein
MRGPKGTTLAVVVTVCSAACTSVLGDFSSGPGSAGDGGVTVLDATTTDVSAATPEASVDAGTVPGDEPIEPGDAACGDAPCATQVSANGNHTCALMADETVRCWGSNTSGESIWNGPSVVNVPTVVSGIGPARDIRIGDRFACVLLVDQSVWCWGDNTSDMLGTADAGFARDAAPDAARVPSPPLQVVGPGTASLLGLGAYHACLITTADAGQVMCWGQNGYGQSGGTSPAPVASPTVVPVTQAVRLELGAFESCVVRSNLASGPEGECMGENVYGELGRGAADASATDNLIHSTLAAVNFGAWGPLVNFSHSTGYHMGAIFSSGDIALWGDNSNGQLGPQVDGGASAIPMLLPGFNDVTQLSFPEFSSCALRVDGTVWCWGSTAFGQNGSTAIVGAVQATPSQVLGISGATQIAAGLNHVCALVGPGIVECWGENDSNQLGRTTTANYDPTPAPVQF